MPAKSNYPVASAQVAARGEFETGQSGVPMKSKQTRDPLGAVRCPMAASLRLHWRTSTYQKTAQSVWKSGKTSSASYGELTPSKKFGTLPVANTPLNPNALTIMLASMESTSTRTELGSSSTPRKRAL